MNENEICLIKLLFIFVKKAIDLLLDNFRIKEFIYYNNYK